jgi:hypothetical protein
MDSVSGIQKLQRKQEIGLNFTQIPRNIYIIYEVNIKYIFRDFQKKKLSIFWMNWDFLSEKNNQTIKHQTI